MSARTFTHSGAAGGPARRRLALAKACRRLFAGNGSREDGEIVLAHLADVTGYFRRPSYGEWIARTKTPHGFELHSALCNARAETLQTLLDVLRFDDEDLMALERAARLEGEG